MNYKSKKPEMTGWYVWRSAPDREPEIVHVWEVVATTGDTRYGSPDAWPMSYGWVRPTHATNRLFLAKRLHAPASMVDEDIGGQYLYDGELPVNALEYAIGSKAKNTAAKQEADQFVKEAAKKKTNEKGGQAGAGSEGRPGSVSFKPPGVL
jgi:hypothetical protein